MEEMSQDDKGTIESLIKEVGKDVRKEVVRILGVAGTGLIIMSFTFYYNTSFKMQQYDDRWDQQKEINSGKIDKAELILFKEYVQQKFGDVERSNEEIKHNQERTINLIIESRRQ